MLETKRIGVVIGIASLFEMAGVILMAFYHSVPMFYISGILIGVAQAFTGFVAVPIVINMWFHKKAGTVLGIVIAVGNAATVAYGLLSAWLITEFGWREAYLILGLIGLIVTVPIVFMVIKSPTEVGCSAYGMEESDQISVTAEEKHTHSSEGWGLTRRQAFHTPIFYMVWLTCIFYSIGSGVSGYIATFSTMEMRQSISFGAQAGMFLNIGTIVCSMLLGHINDKFGVKAGLAWGALVTALGYGLMFAAYKNIWLIFPASLFVGLGNSMYTVQSPLIAREVLGERHYSSIWAVMMIVNSLVGGGLYSSIGLFYDKLGSYKGAFLMATGLTVAALFVGALAVNGGEKLKKGMRAG